jgi:hypothetical protein
VRNRSDGRHSRAPKFAFTEVDAALTPLMVRSGPVRPSGSRLKGEDEANGPRSLIIQASHDPKTGTRIDPIRPASGSPANKSGFGDCGVRIVHLALGCGLGNGDAVCIPINPWHWSGNSGKWLSEVGPVGTASYLMRSRLPCCPYLREGRFRRKDLPKKRNDGIGTPQFEHC